MCEIWRLGQLSVWPGVIIRGGRYSQEIMDSQYNLCLYYLSPELIGFLIVVFPNM